LQNFEADDESALLECTPATFERPSVALGDRYFSLRLGHLCYRFEGLPQSLAAEANRIYAPFLSQDPPHHTVRVARGASRYLEYLPDGLLRIEQRSYPEGTVLVSTHFAAFRPADGKTGTLLVSGDANAKLALGAMENYLRWTVANVELERGGFVLHCSGLVRNGRAYIFFGHSGAGKSTVASLSPEASVLSDDLVLLQRSQGNEELSRPGLQGQGRASLPHGWSAATTPFAGEFDQAQKTVGNFPVAGVFLLKKSSEVKLAPMSASIATAALFSCCPFVAEPARSTLLLPRVENLASSVLCYELHFRKDSSFWDAISRELK
jgi:hypothetical protein